MANLGFVDLPMLPLETQENIVKDLSYPEIINFCLVQSGFADLCSDEDFWREVLVRRDPYYPDSNPDWEQISAKEMVRRYDTMYGVIVYILNQEKPLYFKWTTSLDRVIGILIWYDVIRHTLPEARISVLTPGGGEFSDQEMHDLIQPYITSTEGNLKKAVKQSPTPIYELSSSFSTIDAQDLIIDENAFGDYRNVGTNFYYRLYVTGITEEMFDGIQGANTRDLVKISKYEVGPDGEVKVSRRNITFS